jgi:uncharacterized LabA/DUF88 family protein
MMAPRRVFGRAIAFLDGQNLYYAARRAFGYSYPNYNPVALARSLCGQQRLRLIETRFYTGVPDLGDDAFWHQFWSNKLAAMGRQGVVVYSRPLRYHEHRIKLPDGTQHAFRSAEEKGIDVRIALDVISLAYQQSYEVALIFSQDQDLSEVAREIRMVAAQQQRWIKVASAFPFNPVNPKARGIDWTDWIRIDRATYDACLDLRDYRPKSAKVEAGNP